MIAKPNAGLPDPVDGHYDMGPEAFAAALTPCLDLGVTLFGGCCGTSPAYIRAVAAALEGKTPAKRHYDAVPFVCTATEPLRLDGVELTAGARKQMKELEALGFDKLPICMAKTQYSFSDDAAKLGAPKDFNITVRNLKVSAGAGFLVALTGDIMTMPGLPKVPAAEKIDVDENGKITGLF